MEIFDQYDMLVTKKEKERKMLREREGERERES